MNLKLTIKWLLVFIWMAFIFTMSGYNSHKSWDLTKKVKNSIESAGEIVAIEKPDKTVSDKGILAKIEEHRMLILRKGAHVFEYTVLFILLFTAFIESLKKTPTYLFAGVITLLYSISDEIHQHFVPGRQAGIDDVFIDNVGTLCGIFAVFSYFYLKKKFKPEN